MLKNRLCLFMPACVRGIITPEHTQLINVSSELFNKNNKVHTLGEKEGENIREQKQKKILS